MTSTNIFVLILKFNEMSRSGQIFISLWRRSNESIALDLPVDGFFSVVQEILVGFAKVSITKKAFVGSKGRRMC